MKYQMLVLDLDGTLTNSKKEITEPTRKALLEIQKEGKIVVLASGRPINGVAPLADILEMEKIRRIHAFFQRCPHHQMFHRRDRLQPHLAAKCDTPDL